MHPRAFRTVLPLAALGLSLASASAAAAGDAEAGAAKARACQTCHGRDGIATMPQFPNLAGQSEIYLVEQLRNFRSGKRQNEQMAVVAKPLSDQDIADLAAHFAGFAIAVTGRR